MCMHFTWFQKGIPDVLVHTFVFPFPGATQLESQLKSVFFFAILQLVRPGPALSIFLEYLLFQEYSFLLWKPRTVLGFVLKQQGQRRDVAVADAPMTLVGVEVH